MPTRVSLPLALLASVVAIAAGPSSALAFGWTPKSVISADGAAVVDPPSNPTANLRVAAAPDGSVAVAWLQSDGSTNRVAARRFSAATGDWMGPTYVSAEGEDVSTYEVMMDTDGNTTIAWSPSDYETMKAATLRASQDTWSEPVTLASGGVRGGGFSASPDGTITVAYVAASDQTKVALRTRARNSVAWTDPVTVSAPAGTFGGPVNLAFNRNGDGALLGFAADGGTHTAYVSRYTHATGTWSPDLTTVYSDSNDFNTMSDLAIAANGDIAALIELDSFTPYVRVLKAGGALGPLHELGAGGFRVIPQVAADENDRFVAAWQTVTGVPDATLETIVSDSDGTWGAPTMVTAHGGAQSLAGDEDGRIAMTYVNRYNEGADHMNLNAVTWSADDRSWQPAGTPAEGSVTIFTGFSGYGAVPRMALGGQGSMFAVWSENLGSTWGVGFATGDGDGPVISGLSVPGAATTGEAVPMSVNASDPWSEVASVTWDFGDGASGSGESAGHAYAVAGTYTVTVTATDGAGNASSSSRQVVVSDPPAEVADAPKPPVVIAPVIEARLAGKTVTVNAKVTLKAGQKCKGTITVTTAFGGKTYKAPAKLALKNGACRATAQITLKKTPSLRTKLRVTVGATKADKKKIAARTITSRRG